MNLLAMLAVSGLAATASPLVKARPYHERVPAKLDASRPAPLLLFLHPYYPGDGQRAVEIYNLGSIVEDKGLLLAAPDGTLEGSGAFGSRFWNATDACCDFGHRGVDDMAYLDAVIADMRARHRVDDRRIFVIGYSNGGYMTHRLLCERASTFAAGASIAGAGWKDAGRCRPAVPAALLEVHGDADELVRFQGGNFPGGVSYPSAVEGIADWASKIGCRGPPRDGPARDLLPSLPGDETAVSRHACRAGAAELWTVRGGHHRGLAPAIPAAIDFLLAHPKTR